MLLCDVLRECKFPWERGHLRRIFANTDAGLTELPSFQLGRSDLLQLHVATTSSGRPEPEICVPESASSDLFLRKCIYKDVVRFSEPLNYAELRDAARIKAIDGWWDIISCDLATSVVGSTARMCYLQCSRLRVRQL